MISRTRDFCRRVYGCLRTFPSWADYRAFRECERATIVGEAMPLRVRGLSAPVWCRPGTTDATVLYETFAGRYHLPSDSLPARPVVIDLGANVGLTAVDFATRYPNSRVIAVEMDPGNCQIARKNIAPFGQQIHLVEAAVWHEDGEIEYGGDAAWGLHVEAGTGRKAPAVCLRTLLDKQGIERVDYIKMDIEGAEARVISSDADWLNRVDSIQVECHPPATPDEIMRVLRSFGFNVRNDRRGILGTRRRAAS